MLSFINPTVIRQPLMPRAPSSATAFSLSVGKPFPNASLSGAGKQAIKAGVRYLTLAVSTWILACNQLTPTASRFEMVLETEDQDIRPTMFTTYTFHIWFQKHS